jgi:predicted PhzF superfamily epimerase YddE/YHI9
MVEPVVSVVRVFANESGEFGNPLGIVQSSPASEGREQQIALELNFSETVFIDSVEEGVATIRIFTPAAELPFAGHPSVGTGWWLREQGTPVDVLREKAGDVAVRFDGDLTWITGRAEWAPKFEWIPLPTPGDVDALDPDDFDAGHSYAHSWIDEPSGRLRSRMFARELGVPEDEATGAAAVRITTVLGRDLEISQGRGSRIHTRQLADGFVEVGGRVVALR